MKFVNLAAFVLFSEKWAGTMLKFSEKFRKSCAPAIIFVVAVNYCVMHEFTRWRNGVVSNKKRYYILFSLKIIYLKDMTHIFPPISKLSLSSTG